MDNRSPIRGIIATGLATILLVSLLCAATAGATTRSITGKRHGDRVTFRVTALRGADVGRAFVMIGQRRYRLTRPMVKRAVRSGRLTVKLAKRKSAKGKSGKSAKRGRKPVLVVKVPPLKKVLFPVAAPATSTTAPASSEPSTSVTDVVTETVTAVGEVIGSVPGLPDAPAPSTAAPEPAPTASAPASPVLIVEIEIPPVVAPEETPAAPSAPPAPTAPSAACPTDLASFAGGAGPPACWRPYADSSPFNDRLGADAQVSPHSAEYVRQLTKFGAPNTIAAGAADSENDWSHPTFYSRPSDPLYTLHCTEAWGRCAFEGMRVRVPVEARPAAGGDAHMTIVDSESGWEYDLYDVHSPLPAPGGTINTDWGGRTRIDGDGLGSDATAARFGNLAGIIRAPELAAGKIDHALFMVYPCGEYKTWVYPAMKDGASCAQGAAGAFPMGTRFQLDMTDAEIEAKNFPRWKTTILKALAHYGMYFGDTGATSWSIMAESSTTYTAFGLADPLLALAKDAGMQPGSWGIAWMNFSTGVDWTSRLRAIAPCDAQDTC